MTPNSEKSCQKILSNVEGMMDTIDVARLTADQFAEIKRLKSELEGFCSAGDDEHAQRTEQLIVAIIKEGPPGYG